MGFSSNGFEKTGQKYFMRRWSVNFFHREGSEGFIESGHRHLALNKKARFRKETELFCNIRFFEF
jgi:hypothetical protein